MRISDWSSDVCSSDLAALWLLAGLWAALRGIAMQRRSAFVAGQAERLASLVEASPQLPVIVRADWRIEASERLGRWLGLERGPRNFDELRGLGSGLADQAQDALRQGTGRKSKRLNP